MAHPTTCSRSTAQGQTIMMEPLAVDLQEASKLVGVSKYTLRAYVRRGWLKATRCGRRIVIPMTELKRLVEDGAPVALGRDVRENVS